MSKIVEAGVVPWRELPTNLPGAAIENSKSFDLLHRKEGVSECFGHTIVRSDWNDLAFRIHLDNKQVIEFGRAGGFIDYTILDKVADDLSVSDDLGEEVAIRLGDQNFVWKRADLMRGLVGSRLQNIFVTPNILFLYGSKFRILAVSSLKNLNADRYFLYWRISD